MEIEIVSFSSYGGAGKVANTLNEGFRKIGLESRFIRITESNLRQDPFKNPKLLLSALSDNFLVKDRHWETLISLRRDKNSGLRRSLGGSRLTIFRWMNGLLGKEFADSNPQITNLVWGLDDMNPFTGVCHYSADCRGFESGCYGCPAVRKSFQSEPAKNLERKLWFADRFNPRYVAPTDWIHDEFKSSVLGKNRESKKILNPLPSMFFMQGKEVTEMGNNLKILIVAANLDDPTKGLWDIIETLASLMRESSVSITLIGTASNKLKAALRNASFLGQLDSESIIGIMRQQDVLLVPSLFENAGTVVAEAASQGLPTIARRIGGMPEMTNYGETGYLFDDQSQLSQIVSSLTKSELRSKGLLARDWSQQLKPELIARQYAEAFLK